MAAANGITGRVLENGTKEFSDFIEKHNVNIIPGTRSIIIVDVHQVGSSCGFSVPYYDFKEYRPILNEFMEKKQKKFLAGEEKESMDRWVTTSLLQSQFSAFSLRRCTVLSKANSAACPLCTTTIELES